MMPIDHGWFKKIKLKTKWSKKYIIAVMNYIYYINEPFPSKAKASKYHFCKLLPCRFMGLLQFDHATVFCLFLFF